MSQAISERKTPQKAPGTRSRPARSTSPEHPLEMEARLRIQEDDARWRRTKEKILVGSAVAVILDACVVSTLLIVSKSSTPSDRQLAFLVMGQIIALLVGVLVGKNLKWKS